VKMCFFTKFEGRCFKVSKLFLGEHSSSGQFFDVKAVEVSAANLTRLFNDNFGRSLTGGYGKDSDWDWNTIAFTEWTRAVLFDYAMKIHNGTDMIEETIAEMLDVLKADRNSTIKKPFTECVEELIPIINANSSSDEVQRLWRERGIHLTVSTMAEAPSSLLRSFPGSLRGILPPPPTVVYSVNAILAKERCSTKY